MIDPKTLSDDQLIAAYRAKKGVSVAPLAAETGRARGSGIEHGGPASPGELNASAFYGGSAVAQPAAQANEFPQQYARARETRPTDAAFIMPALIAQESGGRAGVLGPQTQWGRAIGRTQMLPATAREMAQKIGVPFDEALLRGTTPEAAAYQDRLGQAYLEQGLQETGNVYDALRYYHGGPDRNLWGPKTERYAREVMARLEGGETAPMTAQPEAPAQENLSGLSDEALLAAWHSRMAKLDGPQADQSAEGSSETHPIDLTGTLYEDQVARLTKGAWVKDRFDRVYQLETDAWLGNPDGSSERQSPRVAVDYQTPTDTALAAATAFSEQIPVMDEVVALGAGALSGRGFDAVRETQMIDRQRLNDTQGVARDVGGVAGFTAGLFLPGVAASGKYIAGGRNLAQRAARASAVSAGYGSLYGAGNTDGGFAERATGAGVGAAAGLLTGAAGQPVVERLAPALTAGTSVARQLSREGVELTPGQMLDSTPVIGGLIHRFEEGLTSVPFSGGAVTGARQRGVVTFNRAAINQSLEPLGEKLPKGLDAGYEAVAYAQDRISDAYERLLPRLSAEADGAFVQAIDDLRSRAAVELPDNYARQLEAVLDQRILRTFGGGQRITGQAFKDLESQLSTLARDNFSSADGAARSFSRMVGEAQNAMREMLARQNPADAGHLRKINQAFMRLVRVENAAGSSASQATGGVFSPTQFGFAVNRGASRSQRAAGEAPMQNLAVNARGLLTSRTPDTGSAGRVGLLGLLSGAASLATAGAPIIATGLVYSGPAQKALNAIYRATDSRSAREALELLGRYAQRNPALQPYYADALSVAARLPGTREQSRPQAAGGLLGPTAAQ